MNRERVKELLPVMQAFAEGKTIQHRTADDHWVDFRDPNFTSKASEYRIKPEPQKFWAVFSNTGTLLFSRMRPPAPTELSRWALYGYVIEEHTRKE